MMSDEIEMRVEWVPGPQIEPWEYGLLRNESSFTLNEILASLLCPRTTE